MTRIGCLVLATAVASAGCAGSRPDRDAYRAVGQASELKALVGQRVVVRGSVSDTPWQHLVASVPGRNGYYFDMEGWQIVVYAEREPASGPILVYGTVLEVEGGGKRPGKSEERFVEYHVLCDFWERAE